MKKFVLTLDIDSRGDCKNCPFGEKVWVVDDKKYHYLCRIGKVLDCPIEEVQYDNT